MNNNIFNNYNEWVISLGTNYNILSIFTIYYDIHYLFNLLGKRVKISIYF